MTRSFPFTSVLLTALVAVVSLAAQSAQAQVTKPFKINGQGVAPIGLSYPESVGGTGDAVPHCIAGNAHFLGRHYGEGTELTLTAVINPADGSIAGTFESGSSFQFKGANGDILSCTYGDTDRGASTQGTYTLTPVSTPGFGELYIANFIAEFVPQSNECTGKYAGVTGRWVMYATSKPFRLGSTDRFHYSWHGEGTLTFNH